MASEFELISCYFNREGLVAPRGEAVPLAIGDDCALLAVPAGHVLAVSMDSLVEGVHFPQAAPADLVAQRALRVNLSDLAAMGADPFCFTLALTLPHSDDTWLQDFSDGLRDCAQAFACPLVGGNTACGPLNIAIQVQGLVPSGRALTRQGAAPGDAIFVSGRLGAAAALAHVTGQAVVSGVEAGQAMSRLYYLPEPRLTLGSALRGLASACIDVSDGLVADLGHIARASGVCMQVEAGRVPIYPEAVAALGPGRALELALCGGDDYELAFTVPAGNVDAMAALSDALAIDLTCIGEVMPVGEGRSPVECRDEQGLVFAPAVTGYRHFQ